jgi:hypothetical protein
MSVVMIVAIVAMVVVVVTTVIVVVRVAMVAMVLVLAVVVPVIVPNFVVILISVPLMFPPAVSAPVSMLAAHGEWPAVSEVRIVIVVDIPMKAHRATEPGAGAIKHAS